jgi:hypothetical protein
LDFEKKKKIEEEKPRKMAEEERNRLKELHFMRCPKCGCDPDKIIERSTAYFEKEERDAKDFQRDLKKEEYNKHKHYKRKSFGTELFY